MNKETFNWLLANALSAQKYPSPEVGFAYNFETGTIETFVKGFTDLDEDQEILLPVGFNRWKAEEIEKRLKKVIFLKLMIL